MKIAILTVDNRGLFADFANPVPHFGTAPEALLQGFADSPELEIHVISCLRRPVKSVDKLARNIFFHSLFVPKIGWIRTFYQGCIRATRKKLREIQPDIVHGQGSEYDGAISAALSGFPNVVTIHGNMAELARLFKDRIGSFMWVAGRIEDFALPRTGGVFCNSAYTEGLIKPRARRIWRVPNPIRESFFMPAVVAQRADRCIIVAVGVISARKRQLELLDVARRLNSLGLKFEFWFIGRADPKSPYAMAFLERIKPLEAVGCARYLGEKSVTELITCCDQAAAAVHFPSEEAFGLVVAEALARGLKFFGSRLGGIRDIAEGIPAAELFDREDWEGLGKSIADWIKQGFRRPGSAAAIRERYHPEVIARRHVEIYREVLSRRS
jgi:glycosyltransferase involved in cell wall biosynthesis